MSILRLVTALLILVGLGCAIGLAQIGVGVKVPLTAFAQFWMTPNLAIEAGLPLEAIGIALTVNATAKLYFGAFDLAGLALEPFAGAGVSLIMAGAFNTGFHALAGLEYTIPQTALSLFGELGISYAQVMGFGGLGFGGAVGARLDF